MKQILILITILCTLSVRGQEIFFQSAQKYNPDHLENFYASLAVQNNLLLFNAPDYNLYAYDKSTGTLKWTHRLGWKSDTPPFFVQDYILANNQKERVVKLDTATGALLKMLPFSNISSQPVIRNSLLYTTGIYEGGNLLAYDSERDSIIWYRFLAHGYERPPYFHADRIWANGEGDTWFEFDYDGHILGTACDTADPEYPFTDACRQEFIALTHDGHKINGKLGKRMGLSGYNSFEMIHTAGATLVLNEGTLYSLGKHGKLKSRTALQSLMPGLEEDANTQHYFLKAEGSEVSLLYNNHLLVYDFKRKRLSRKIDLSAWQPHNPLLDGNLLWFVSQNDGLLYGMRVGH